MRRQRFPVAGSFDDILVTRVGQAAHGAVARDGVVKKVQPFVHGPVAGDDEAERTAAIEDDLIEVCGLLRS